VTTTGTAVDAPSGQLVALAAGPVGGVGTGGDRAKVPQLSLAIPDGMASRLSPDAGKASGATPASLTTGDGGALRAAVAEVGRLTGLQRWWNMLFNGAPAPDDGDDDGAGLPEAARPPEGEQAAPETTPANGRDAGAAPTIVAGLAALAVAVSAPREERRLRDRVTR
jgi:hypothetical protein